MRTREWVRGQGTMMKLHILAAAMILAFAVAAGAQKVSIRAAQQKAVAGTGLKIKFVSVLEDSRCPENVQCIWAGVGRISIEVRKNGKPPKTFELNTNQLDKPALYDGVEIGLVSLAPYPRTSTQIPASKYVASFNIRKLK